MMLAQLGAGGYLLVALLVAAAYGAGWLVGMRRSRPVRVEKEGLAVRPQDARQAPTAPSASAPPKSGIAAVGSPLATETAEAQWRPMRQTLGRYRIERELGRGGMGRVMLAHDTALDILVAVKLVPELVIKDTDAVNDLRK